ncbi:MAG: putative sugar nucleotidyl transferase [Thermoprotei archaeon]
MNIVIFEDSKQLHPFTLLKPSFEIFHGAYSILSFFTSTFSSNDKLKIFVASLRNEIMDELKSRFGAQKIWNESMGSDSIIINGRAIINEQLIKLLNKVISNPPSTNKLFFSENGSLVIGYLINDVSAFLNDIMKGVINTSEVTKIPGLRTFENIWDYIVLNKTLMLQHSAFLKNKLHDTEYKDVYTMGSVEVENSVIFNTKNGPIIIGDKCYIQGPSRIEGPTFIGDNVMITAHAHIRGSSIGSNSIIGGEVTNSIISMNTNSRHQSYIGDSYIGEYVNVGALTVFSNVKNTMGYINVDLYDRKIRTNLTKLGAFVGDHVKISVGTTIYGGKIIGASAHIYSKADRSIPSFTIWLGDKEKAFELEIESVIESAKRFMKSKGKIMSLEYEQLLRDAFKKTEIEREKFGVIRGKAMF